MGWNLASIQERDLVWEKSDAPRNLVPKVVFDSSEFPPSPLLGILSIRRDRRIDAFRLTF